MHFAELFSLLSCFRVVLLFYFLDFFVLLSPHFFNLPQHCVFERVVSDLLIIELLHRSQLFLYAFQGADEIIRQVLRMLNLLRVFGGIGFFNHLSDFYLLC